MKGCRGVKGLKEILQKGAAATASGFFQIHWHARVAAPSRFEGPAVYHTARMQTLRGISQTRPTTRMHPRASVCHSLKPAVTGLLSDVTHTPVGGQASRPARTPRPKKASHRRIKATSAIDLNPSSDENNQTKKYQPQSMLDAEPFVPKCARACPCSSQVPPVRKLHPQCNPLILMKICRLSCLARTPQNQCQTAQEAIRKCHRSVRIHCNLQRQKSQPAKEPTIPEKQTTLNTNQQHGKKLISSHGCFRRKAKSQESSREKALPLLFC